MIAPVRRGLAAAALLLIAAAAAKGQERAGLMGDLMKDVTGVQEKLISLAKTVPFTKYDWRPGDGVRSIGEVFLHVAADNLLLPSALGVEPDPATGIKTTDFKTLDAFEKQKLDRDATIAAVEKSFAHLLKSMRETADARLDDHVKLFGSDMTVRQMWVLTTTHLHEHLGQSIAYARSNGVVPPWSK